MNLTDSFSSLDADFLHMVFLGNELRRWLIALFVFLAVWVFVRLALRILVAKLDSLSKLTPTKLDDLAVRMLSRVKGFFILGWALYLAVVSLSVSPGVQTAAHRLALLLTTIQIALWGNVGISFWVEEYLRPRALKDSSAVTTVNLLTLLARAALLITIFLLALNNLGVDITALVAGLGVGGIAVALAVQNILGDLFASLTIALDKPFVVGDFIVVGDMMGTVEHVGMKTTRIRSLSGEQLVFSNADLLQSRIRNFKRMQERRVVFMLGVTYETPEDRLRQVTRIAREAIESQENTRFDRANFKAFGPSSLDFEIIYMISSPDAAVFAKIQEDVNFRILQDFRKLGIEFAYPTQTVHVNQAAAPALRPS